MLLVKLKKQFASFNLDLSLEIKPSFTALFGPSGSGKTTTLNLIAGLLQPSEGEIELDGRTLYSKSSKINVPPEKRSIGYIFQESRLFPHMTVKNNLLFGWQRTPAKGRKFALEETVEVTGVRHLLNRKSEDLSGGEKQRVALARALLAAPDYLLMDEPLAALDLTTRLSFLNFLKDVHKRYDLPILYVSHDLANVLNFADQIVVLENGKSIGYGSTYSLFDKIKTAPLVSGEDIANIFEVRILSHEPAKGLTTATVGNVTFILPHLSCPVGEKLLLNIPASEIILSPEQPRNLSASNIIAGTVSELHHLGGRVLTEVDAGITFTVEIVQATVKRLALQRGKKVFLIIKASAFRRLS